jgi:hypothetical protein
MRLGIQEQPSKTPTKLLWQIMLNSQYVSHRIHELFRESQGLNFHGIREFLLYKMGQREGCH